jgi:hypothetical protein
MPLARLTRLRHVAVTSLTALSVAASSGCFVRGGGGLFFAVAETALVTAIIVSAVAPPPPRVVFIPEPRAGFVWQPGYWTLHDGDWVWIDGMWVELQPGQVFIPAHWEHAADGNWQLLPGHWVPADQYVPPQPPPPPPPPPRAPQPYAQPAPVPSTGVQYVPAPEQ